MATATKRHLLLTGLPGVGKTTIVQSICTSLKEKGITMAGFYTQELRRNRTRIGFDLVTLDGHQSPLARLTRDGEPFRVPRVGQYHIELESFEKAVLPIFSTTSSPEIIVLDEIGKMELLSDAFYSGVQKIFDQKGGPLILATVPVAKNGRALQVVCNLESRSDCSVYKVTVENRDFLSDLLTKEIITRLKTK